MSRLGRNCAGAVMAGGQSRRMGRDKATLVWRGAMLGTRTAQTLSLAGCEPVVQIGGSSLTGVPIVDDLYPGEGPLGGLLTALASLQQALVAVVACDLPGLGSSTVTRLIDAIESTSQAEVAVARGERLEPLCAVWRREPSRRVGEELWVAGQRSVRALLHQLVAVEVRVAAAEVLNANTPEALHTAGNVDVMADEITVQHLAELMTTGVTLIDVRQPDEYEAGHAPGAVLMPLGAVLADAVTVEGPGPVYVICGSGARSLRACLHLEQQGVMAVNVVGGTMAWMAGGFEVVEGTDPA